MHKMIVIVLFVALAFSSMSLGARVRRAAYDLPAGAKEIMGKDIKTNFKCEMDGFYSDIQNNCKIFHRCDSSAGKKMQHHSFICGEKTQFDQSDFTCKHSEQAIPCESSVDFYGLNSRIGKDGPFLDQSDIDRAKNARPNYRARARK